MIEATDPTLATEPADADAPEEPVAAAPERAAPEPAAPEPAAPEPAAPESAAPAQPVRRASKFLADLSRAMLAAAETARAETMARFDAEAKAVVEDIRARATEEAADLRRKADDDVAAIREWSKAEIARIREETEARIADRKQALEGEVEQHAAVVDTRVERVGAVVTAFETQMAAFFDHLAEEEDPTRIATMAEAMPEPPSLADVAASVVDVPEPAPWAPSADEPASPFEAGSLEFDAAAAEAASFSGDLESEELPEPNPEALEAEVAETAPALDEEPLGSNDLATSRVIVTGLVSVANIANFKRSLGRTPGVSNIAVASGPDGDFIFTVGHTLGTHLSSSVRGLPGFDIQITDESDDAIHVAARDRDAAD
ncbi:MAG TPA: hypothetical protein VFM19_10135 [Candidatus Limnocylindria bacterium]|nr:hypothetical protein [Candidatus Limnocylindria bacterium]